MGYVVIQVQGTTEVPSAAAIQGSADTIADGVGPLIRVNLIISLPEVTEGNIEDVYDTLDNYLTTIKHRALGEVDSALLEGSRIVEE